MDIGGYNLDLVLGLLGFPKVTAASAVTWRAIDRERADREGYDVEDMAVGFIRLEGGAVVSIESSFAGNIDEPNGTWLFGSKAGLRLEPLTLFREKEGEKKVLDVDDADVTPRSPTRQFVEAILNDEPIRTCSGEEALIVTKVQELLYRSAEAGRELALRGELRPCRQAPRSRPPSTRSGSSIPTSTSRRNRRASLDRATGRTSSPITPTMIWRSRGCRRPIWSGFLAQRLDIHEKWAAVRADLAESQEHRLLPGGPPRRRGALRRA